MTRAVTEVQFLSSVMRPPSPPHPQSIGSGGGEGWAARPPPHHEMSFAATLARYHRVSCDREGGGGGGVGRVTQWMRHVSYLILAPAAQSMTCFFLSKNKS